MTSAASAAPASSMSAAVPSGRRLLALTALAPVLLSTLAVAVPSTAAVAATTSTTTSAETAPAVRAATDAGALPIGTAAYAAPATARYVSPNGSDTAAGTATAPWRTVGKAVAAAATGTTVVLRAGTYHESVTVPATKQLTLQNAAGEAVWFDGSKVVSGWVADAGDWRLDGWTATFDHSPTYTPGAPDSTEPGWSFVNANYPMAAYPDQVFVDGVAQQQVKTRDAVTAGTFFVDTTNDKIYLGTDPTGREVRSSALQTAVTLNSAGSVLRGVGVRRYATSLPLMGTVRALGAENVLENVEVSDNATQGVFVRGAGSVVRHVTSSRNGLMGLLANNADGLLAEGVRTDRNNTEHFNGAPAAGGFKLTRLRGVTVKESEFLDNEGSGLWFDESVYDATVVGNDSIGNTRNGISFEISSKALIADNLIARNGTTGLKVNNAQHVSIWNNTITGNKGRPMWLVQDDRVASDLSEPGHDTRQALPDPTVTWILGPLTVKNNVITGGSGANCLLCAQDGALLRTAETIGLTTDGNVYSRPSTTTPTWVALWPNGTTSTKAFTTVSAYRTAKRQELTGVEHTGASILDASFRLVPSVAATQSSVAQPLDAAVADATGGVAGDKSLGAFLP